MLHKTDVHVGANLRIARILHGMTQTELAAQLGISFQQVQKYEKGSNRIGASRLKEISDIFLVPVDFFFDGLSEGVTMTDKISSVSLRIAREIDKVEDPTTKQAFLDLLKLYTE